MKSLPTLRQRLSDLLPGDEEIIFKTRSTKILLEIAVNALEFRSDVLSRTGFELGRHVGREYKRQGRASSGKAQCKHEIDLKMMDGLEEAYVSYQKHERVTKGVNPKQKARETAWEQML